MVVHRRTTTNTIQMKRFVTLVKPFRYKMYKKMIGEDVAFLKDATNLFRQHSAEKAKNIKLNLNFITVDS